MRAILIAGPNGAGKSTFAREYLLGEAHCLKFINADLIAAGVSPFAPELAAMRAGRIMLEEIDECVRKRITFAVETTLSGRSYVQRIHDWKAHGYHVKLVFLKLPDADAAVARVALRVQQGGHSVPEDVIRRRFAAGYDNFLKIYRDIVDEWAMYDSSVPIPSLVEWGEGK